MSLSVAVFLLQQHSSLSTPQAGAWSHVGVSQSFFPYNGYVTCGISLALQHYLEFNSIQFKKTLFIPQGPALLWSRRAREIITHKAKRTIRQTHHQQQKDFYFNHSYSYKYRTIVTSSSNGNSLYFSVYFFHVQVFFSVRVPRHELCIFWGHESC